MRAVVRKDLTQQGPLLLGAAALCAVALLVCTGARVVVGGRLSLVDAALLEGYADYVRYALTPFAVLLARQLVLPELQVGLATLRRLPVGLGRVYLGKAVAGASVLVALTACGLSLSASLLRVGGPLDRALLLELATGSLAWLAGVFALALLWASLGRWRHAALLLAAGAVLLGGARWEAPVELTQSGFRAAAASLELGRAAAVGLVVGAGLWSWRGGVALTWFSGPAGLAERAVVAALLVVGALALAPAARTLSLDGETVDVGVAGVTVRKVGTGERSAAVAQRAAAVVADFERRVGIRAADLAIEHGPEFGSFRERAGGLAPGQVLVRMDLESAPAQRGVVGWWAAALLDASTRGRLRAAPWRWLLDGYAAWFEPVVDDRALLRAAWAARQLAARDLLEPGLCARWDQVRAALGDPLARAFAGWLLTRLGASTTPSQVERLVAAAAQDRLSVWAALPGGRGRWETLAGSACERAWADVEADLCLEARALAAAHASSLEALKEPSPGEITVADGGGQVRLAFRATGRTRLIHALADQEPAPPHYHQDAGDASREPLLSEVAYPPGSRLRVAFARWLPELGCDVISGWEVLELP